MLIYPLCVTVSHVHNKELVLCKTVSKCGLSSAMWSQPFGSTDTPNFTSRLRLRFPFHSTVLQCLMLPSNATYSTCVSLFFPHRKLRKLASPELCVRTCENNLVLWKIAKMEPQDGFLFKNGEWFGVFCFSPWSWGIRKWLKSIVTIVCVLLSF